MSIGQRVGYIVLENGDEHLVKGLHASSLGDMYYCSSIAGFYMSWSKTEEGLTDFLKNKFLSTFGIFGPLDITEEVHAYMIERWFRK